MDATITNGFKADLAFHVLVVGTNPRDVIPTPQLSGIQGSGFVMINLSNPTITVIPPTLRTGFLWWQPRSSISISTNIARGSPGAVGFNAVIYQVPYWSIVILALLPPAAIMLIRWLTRARFVVGCCANCGYDLRATPQRCPECGMPTVMLDVRSAMPWIFHNQRKRAVG